MFIEAWIFQRITLAISQSPTYTKHVSTLRCTLQTIYANKTNMKQMVEIYESIIVCKQGDQYLQDHFVYH